MSEKQETLQKNLTFQERNAERLKRLRDLHTQRVSFYFWSLYNVTSLFSTYPNLYFKNEARKLNHEAVKEEELRNSLPINWEARKRRGEWLLKDEAHREEAKKKVKTPIVSFHFSQYISSFILYSLGWRLWAFKTPQHHCSRSRIAWQEKEEEKPRYGICRLRASHNSAI